MASAITRGDGGRWNPCTAFRQRAGNLASGLTSRLSLLADSIFSRTSKVMEKRSVRIGVYHGMTLALISAQRTLLTQGFGDEVSGAVAMGQSSAMLLLCTPQLIDKLTGSNFLLKYYYLENLDICLVLVIGICYPLATAYLFGFNMLPLAISVGFAAYDIGNIRAVREKISQLIDRWVTSIRANEKKPILQNPHLVCTAAAAGGLYLGSIGALASSTAAGYYLSQKEHEE